MHGVPGFQISVELSGLKQKMIAMLGAYDDDIEKKVEKALEAVAESLDVEALVRQHAKPAIEAAIKECVERAARSLVYDEKFFAAVRSHVAQNLAKPPYAP